MQRQPSTAKVAFRLLRAGSYRVMFRLKKHEKAVAAATATIQVQPGLRDISQ